MIKIPTLTDRLVRGGVWAFSGKVATGVAWIVVNALLARLLSPSDVGAYFIAFSIVSLGALIGSLGLNAGVVRFVAESMALNKFSRTRRAVNLTFRIGAIGSLATGFLYLLFGGFLGSKLFEAPALVSITGLVAGWMVVLSLQTLLAETFRGFHDIRQATIVGGLATNVSMAGFLGLVWIVQGKTTLATVLILAVVSGLASGLLASWILHRKVAALPFQDAETSKDRLQYSDVLSVAWPLLIGRLAIFLLTQADIWILSVFRPEEDVALYGAASRLAAATILMVTSILYAVLPPLIAEKYALGQMEVLEKLLRTGAAVTVLAALPVFLMFVVAPEAILGLVYGRFYESGSWVLMLLSIGLLVNAATGLHGYVLTMTGHERTQLVVFLIGGGINIALCVLGAIYWGIYGVAAAAMFAMILQCLLEVVVIHARIGVWMHASPRYVKDIKELLITRLRGGSGG